MEREYKDLLSIEVDEGISINLMVNFNYLIIARKCLQKGIN
jgi:hypothetical protein